MEALRAKLAERDAAAKAEQAAKVAAAEAEYARRAEEAGHNPAMGARYDRAVETGGMGTIPMPKTWFGAEQDALVAAIDANDVAELTARMNALCAATDDGDIKLASARLQSLFREKASLTSLINAQIMHAFVTKMQAYRKVTFANSMQRSASRAKSADAHEAGKALLGMLDDDAIMKI